MKFENIQVISWDIYGDIHSSEKNLSHSILIPNNIMDTFLYNHLEPNNPILFIEIKDMNGHKNTLLFSNAGVTESNVCVLPYWAMSKLQLSQFDMISLENVNNIQKVGFIKIKANISNYVFWEDIKKILENELENYRCISIGDLISIADVEFYVTELHDINSILINHGSLYDTDPSIEFDVPIDLENKEQISNNQVNSEKEYIHRTINEMENDDNTTRSALSFRLTFHTGEEIKEIERYYAEQKNKIIINKRK
jgi:hypothetical protein